MNNTSNNVQRIVYEAAEIEMVYVAPADIICTSFRIKNESFEDEEEIG